MSGAALVLGASGDASIYQTPTGRAVQAITWDGVSRLRVFVALQVLLGAILTILLGFFGLLGGWRPARILWPMGLLLLLIYYGVDPRFRVDEFHLLLRGGLVFFAGILLGSRVLPPGQDRAPAWRRQVFEVLGVFLLFFITTGIARLATGAALSEGLVIEAPGIYALSFLFFGAVSAGRAPSELRARTKTELSAAAWGWKGVLTTTLLSALVAVLVGGAVIYFFGKAEHLIWALAVPVTPGVLSVYGPMSWFTVEGSIFAVESASPGFSSRSRLLLGIVFQYFTIVVLWLGITFALRPAAVWRKALYHSVLVAYWVPGIWLMWTLSQAF